MRRTFWFAAAVLAMIAVVAVVHLRWAPDHGGSPVSVSPQQLWRAPEAYRGMRVRASGLLRVFAPGSADEYFVIEQAGQYRVGVRGVKDDVLEPLVGRAVRVEGTFRVDSEFGIVIDATVVEPARSATPGA